MLQTIRNHPVLSYYVLAFGLVWAWVFAIVLPAGWPGSGDALKTLFPLVALGMAIGPALSSVIVTALVEGSDGLRDLWRSLTKWRVAPSYFAIALLFVPACALLVLGVLSIAWPQFAPGIFGPNGLMLFGLGAAYGLIAGGLEEVGWTGFAIRRLQPVWNILGIGVVLGVLHGIWHFPAGFWGEGTAYGGWYLPYFVMCWIVGLTALRILIAWLYERTRSVLVCQLAHASYTGGLVMLWPTATSPAENTLWTSLFAVLLLAAAWGIARFGFAPRRPAAA